MKPNPSPTPTWQIDPTGRHASRLWNGATWTNQVHTFAGEVASDPYSAEDRAREESAALTPAIPTRGVFGIATGVAGLIACTALPWIKVIGAYEPIAIPMKISDINQIVAASGRGSTSSVAVAFFSSGWIMLLLCLGWCAVITLNMGRQFRKWAATVTSAATLWALFAALNLSSTSDDGSTIKLQIGAFLAVLSGVIAACLAAAPRAEGPPEVATPTNE